MLEALRAKNSRGQQGGFASHVLTVKTDTAPYSTNHRTTKLFYLSWLRRRNDSDLSLFGDCLMPNHFHLVVDPVTRPH